MTLTDASVHDSQALAALLEESDSGQDIYADSAYIGENQEAAIDNAGMINRVCEKGYRNNPLTEEQRASTSRLLDWNTGGKVLINRQKREKERKKENFRKM